MRVETPDSHCNVDVESVLRLRPLAKKESDDSVVLEQVRSVIRNGPATVVLNPVHGALMTSPVGGMRARSESDATPNNTPTEYHFNHVLSDSTSQDKIYYTLGLPVATAAMNTLKEASSRPGRRPASEIKSHLLVCMGVTGSGKTYTCFGGNTVPKRRASQDGLIPRLVDSLFSQSKHHASAGNVSKGFAVNISIVQVSHAKGSDPHACHLHDLLGSVSSPTKSKKKSSTRRNLTVRNMAAKFERVMPSPIRSPAGKKGFVDYTEMDTDNISPVVESCADVTQAREVLQKGLTNSAKASKGQNHHLMITMQPVFNGNQYGDKIAILDMAGLEKGKKVHSRGKDSVANKNQAASAAVLHCLRAMIHNTSVRTGRANPLDVADDSMSEISSVSIEKDRQRQQLKPVPFRQHKVTMLLQPFFSSSASANVTLLLAAYPGHADYYEKRLLLQDMELLCGAALLAAPRGDANTGLERSDSQSYLSRDSRSYSSSMDEEDPMVQNGHFRGKAGRATYTTQGRVVGKYSAEAGRTMKLSPSIDEVDEKLSQPPAYAPSYAKPIVNARTSVPTYHASEPMVASVQPSRASRNPAKNPDYVSDFPGTRISEKRSVENPIVERQRVTDTVVSASVGGRKAWAPSSRKEDVKEDLPMNREPVLESVADRDRKYISENKFSRQPLGRSSLENERGNTYHDKNGDFRATVKRESKYETTRSSTDSSGDYRPGSTRTEEVKHQRQYGTESRSVNKRQSVEQSERSSFNRVTWDGAARPGLRSVTQFESSTSITQAKSFDRPNDSETQARMNREAEERIKELEEKMNQLEQEKETYEQRCTKLQHENQELKLDVKRAEARGKNKWTQEDEDQFMRSRQARIEVQTLVKKPLRHHLDRVNYIYDIKNQWAKTDKTHFGLALPSHFQRAPELDLRDKEYEEREAEANARGQPIYDGVVEKKPSNPANEVVTMAQRRGKKSRASEASTSHAALKRVVLTY